jgi:hypothetical protein
MTKLLKSKLKHSDCCIKIFFFRHIIGKIFAQTQMLTEDAKTSLRLKTLVLCALLQTTHPLKISFLFFLLSSVGTTTLSWVSACSTVLKHSQQEGFIQSSVASGTSNPQLGGEPGI